MRTSHVILNDRLYPFIARIIKIHGSGVLVAHVDVACLVPREMLPFRRKFCVHHSTMHQVSVTSFKDTQVGR